MIDRANQEQRLDGGAEGGTRFLLIGGTVIDLTRNLVLRDGDVHRVEPRVMEVLAYLARAGGRIVSRQELMAKVWGVHVVDEAVQRAISLLRTALGCDGRTAPIVETVRGQGYRLTIPPAALAGPDVREPSPRWKSGLSLLAAFAAGIFVALAVFWLTQSPAPAPEAPAASSDRTPATAPPAPR